MSSLFFGCKEHMIASEIVEKHGRMLMDFFWKNWRLQGGYYEMTF